MMGLGRAMAGDSAKGSEKDGFYPTPADVTHALLGAWRPKARVVWEAACGDGAMATVLEQHKLKVLGSDLIGRGYGDTPVNFLAQKKRRANCIITNPPFELAKEFIEQSFALGVTELALVLRSTYWHAARRYPLFTKYRPALILPLLWRPDFMGLGGPTMEIMWCVWRPGANETLYIPLPRPK